MNIVKLSDLKRLNKWFNYRVSRNSLDLFIFWITRLPRGLEIPSWTFFNSHFRAESKKSTFLLFGDIWTEILPKYLEAVILILNIFRLLLNQANEHSGSLMSVHENSGALINIQEHLSAFKSTYEHSWVWGNEWSWMIMVPLLNDNDCWGALMSDLGAISPC